MVTVDRMFTHACIVPLHSTTKCSDVFLYNYYLDIIHMYCEYWIFTEMLAIYQITYPWSDKEPVSVHIVHTFKKVKWLFNSEYYFKFKG